MQGLRLTNYDDDLDDWEVTTGCHQNRTLVPQLIETLVYFWLVQCKSSDIICHYKLSDAKK